MAKAAADYITSKMNTELLARRWRASVDAIDGPATPPGRVAALDSAADAAVRAMANTPAGGMADLAAKLAVCCHAAYEPGVSPLGSALLHSAMDDALRLAPEAADLAPRQLTPVEGVAAQFRQRVRAEGAGWLKRMLDRYGAAEAGRLTTEQMAGAMANRPGREPVAVPDAPPAGPPPATDSFLLRLRDLKALLGVSRSTIYRLIAERGFPKPYLIGARAVAWRRDEVLAWLGELSGPKPQTASPPSPQPARDAAAKRYGPRRVVWRRGVKSTS
jgi:prophage regulatory protein